MLKAGAVLQIAHLLATVSSTNATSTALHASPDPALLPPAFMSGRRPDRTRALNFLSTFRRCSCPCYPHAYDPAVREQQCPEKCPPGCGITTTRSIRFTSECFRGKKVVEARGRLRCGQGRGRIGRACRGSSSRMDTGPPPRARSFTTARTIRRAGLTRAIKPRAHHLTGQEASLALPRTHACPRCTHDPP